MRHPLLAPLAVLLVGGTPACLREPIGTGESDGGTSGPSTSSTSSTTSPGTTTTTGNPTTVTTSSTTTGDTDPDTVTDSSSFVSHDGGTSHPCDQWVQDCPDGLKCMPYANDGGNSWNDTKCVPIDPDPKDLYEPCTAPGGGIDGYDDCDIGMMCWNVDQDTKMGECVGFCTGEINDPTCEDPKAHCILTGDGILILCLPGCDPLLGDCDMGQVCVPEPSGDGFICAVDPWDEPGGHADPCEYVNVCDPGLFCANADLVVGCMGAAGCCAAFCDLTDPLGNDQCPGAAGGEECVPWWEMGMAPEGLEHIGACVIPQ